MRKIYKYPIALGAEYAVGMPKNGSIKHVGMQVGMQGNPTIWVEVDITENLEKRKFKVFGTGHLIDDGAEYVGTCFDGPFVWHVYELK